MCFLAACPLSAPLQLSNSSPARHTRLKPSDTACGGGGGRPAYPESALDRTERGHAKVAAEGSWSDEHERRFVGRMMPPGAGLQMGRVRWGVRVPCSYSCTSNCPPKCDSSSGCKEEVQKAGHRPAAVVNAMDGDVRWDCSPKAGT